MSKHNRGPKSQTDQICRNTSSEAKVSIYSNWRYVTAIPSNPFVFMQSVWSPNLSLILKSSRRIRLIIEQYRVSRLGKN